MSAQAANGSHGARIYHLERRQSTVEVDVAVIRRDVNSIAKDIKAMREETERREERETTTTRWRIGMAVAIVSAILAAAAIVANALQAGVPA